MLFRSGIPADRFLKRYAKKHLFKEYNSKKEFCRVDGNYRLSPYNYSRILKEVERYKNNEIKLFTHTLNGYKKFIKTMNTAKKSEPNTRTQELLDKGVIAVVDGSKGAYRYKHGYVYLDKEGGLCVLRFLAPQIKRLVDYTHFIVDSYKEE